MRLLQLDDLMTSSSNALPEASLFVRLQQRQDCALQSEVSVSNSPYRKVRDHLSKEPPCPDPFSPALRKTHPLANMLKPEDIVRPTIGVKLSLATRPSILAGESCVT